ncbi:hypothetical protein AcW1_004029 [Taiwanofungus camphoratus]|nr:hypothetical protein AcW1_004029 [Antrodia cinnamomea]
MSQSPQRNRKAQMYPGTQGAPRESTPSPSFRERQRAAKAHSLPAVNQLLANQNQQLSYPQGQQPSPTASNSSHNSHRTPPTTSRISPVAAKMSAQTHAHERSPERTNSPPALVHAQSQPIVPHLVPLPPAGPQHTQSQPNVLAHVTSSPLHPRPINRVPPPPFLTQYQGVDEKWQVTDELMADIERADLQQAQAQFSHPAGTSGVAYAGGAASSGFLLQHAKNVAAKDPAVERVRVSDRASPKDQDSSSSQAAAKRQVRDKEREAQNVRESPKTRDRSQTISSISSHDSQTASNRTPEYRGSPQYATPMASPGERTAAYTQYLPDGYQVNNIQQGATPPAMRKTVPGQVSTESAAMRLTPPAASKLATSTHTPPLQAMATRPPDRSLPVQEEPEEDVPHDYVNHEQEYDDRHRGSPTPSSDVYPEGHGPRHNARREHNGIATHAEEGDGDDTLIEETDEQRQQDKSGEDSEAGFTPRSPSVTLPERPRDAQYAGSNVQYGQYPQLNGESQRTVRVKHRSGPTDQLGMRSFDPAIFESTVNSLRSNGHNSPTNGVQQPRQAQVSPQIQPQPHPQVEALRQQSGASRQFSTNGVSDQRTAYVAMRPPQLPHPDDLQSLFEDPTSSYIRTYLQPGSRPNAPIPPTPQSQTAAPSPSPLISAMQSDAEPRQIGSPYPYPFTHIRRTALAAAQQAPSSSLDLNNPAVIREQMARQMQIYASNYGFATHSDSTFSPPATPFPVPGYNPWTFVQGVGQVGVHGGMATSTMSMRSSPSHEPVQLPPPPPMRGRGPRRRDQVVNPHVTQGSARTLRRVKPPPRVESTQPRETSPELSSGSGSGEETAGEERFVEQYVNEGDAEEGTWAHGMGGQHVDDDGEWVDEEEEGEEEDLLDLEFHPTFVSNPQRRRRRWETRWDALTQAFQALDRETDATLIVLASPSHSTKLHALTSRSIRRDPSLLNSPKLAGIRGAFSHLASQRRTARSQRISLAERLHLSTAGSASSANGSPGAEWREEDLRRALEAALGSLNEMGKIHDRREARWRDEMRRLTEDRDRVELVLRQALGPLLTNGHGATQPV